MLHQLFEISRKAAESTLQMQQAMFKHLTQDWLSTSPAAAGISADWGGSMRKRWTELTLEAMSWEPAPPSADSLAALSETVERFMRSPAFLDVMRYSLKVMSRPIGPGI